MGTVGLECPANRVAVRISDLMLPRSWPMLCGMSFLKESAGLGVLVVFTLGCHFVEAGDQSIHPSITSADFVRVSPRDPRYFELSDGRPYIPIGLNMIAPPGNEGLPGLEAWMDRLQANGGNYIRVWLSNPFFDVEHVRCGDYDETEAKRIEAMLTIAARHGIRVKMCMEHFRHLGDGRQAWAAKPLYLVANGGTATNISDFFNGTASREQSKRSWLGSPSGLVTTQRCS